jgi:hypothetical protein
MGSRPTGLESRIKKMHYRLYPRGATPITCFSQGGLGFAPFVQAYMDGVDTYMAHDDVQQ